jgi:hypothetical protein
MRARIQILFAALLSLAATTNGVWVLTETD